MAVSFEIAGDFLFFGRAVPLGLRPHDVNKSPGNLILDGYVELSEQHGAPEMQAAARVATTGSISAIDQPKFQSSATGAAQVGTYGVLFLLEDGWTLDIELPCLEWQATRNEILRLGDSLVIAGFASLEDDSRAVISDLRISSLAGLRVSRRAYQTTARQAPYNPWLRP